MTLIILFLFLLLLAASVPVAFAVGITSLLVLILIGNIPLVVVVQRMFVTCDNYTLLAIIFFVLAGDLMEEGGITDKLVEFANDLVGRFRGGLGMVSVLSGMIFAGISGSAIADTSAIGSLLIPSMVNKGYKKGFVASLIASTGAIGPIIPPSILMIIYGSITDVSIASMFMGGFIPGVLIGLGLMVIVYIYSLLPGNEAMGKGARAPFSKIVQSFAKAIWALLMPLIIIGGILGGIFTATEAGAVAAFYALCVGAFVYRKLKFSALQRIILASSLKAAVILIIIANAGALGWILARIRFPEAVGGAITQFANSPAAVMALVIVFLLILGCFFDVIAATIILVPVLHAIGQQFHFDQVHFAVVVIVTLLIGGVTPPYGVLLFISCGIAKISLKEASRSALPFILVMTGVVFLLAYVPSLVLFIPKLYWQLR
jgi:tripartite ATP-independent transporter DctM subunit